MKIAQYRYSLGQWSPALPVNTNASLVLSFGSRPMVENEHPDKDLCLAFPDAERIGCTTSGGICGDEVYDDTMVVNVFEFASTHIKVVSANQKNSDATHLGAHLANQLPQVGLRYVLALCDGQVINGTAFIEGILSQLPDDVSVSGGLAGDCERFEKTFTWHNESAAQAKAVLCAFYGEKLKISHGCWGGWDPFGPEREITKADQNILYELDDQPALSLYKRYLGDFAKQLPASALRFPLCVTNSGDYDFVVRTLITLDEEQQSMTFAGNLPVGGTARLMKASLEALIDGATVSAEHAMIDLAPAQPSFALLISCVGRRIMLGQRVFEELEAVVDEIGKDCHVSGFYSYGEISPSLGTTQVRLHNQTMTITLLSEGD